ncbi:MAG: glycosyltransferase family 2 protein [Phycisphaerae bacterium]|jgi:cellulose synthase/poly-beta-1,6-N-acetylglucosamine synthase-like glycosyltransferase
MHAESVTLVIPGRNCADTIRQCLEAVVPMLDGTPLEEIIFVDDGSTDDTARIVAEFPVTCLSSGGRGPAAARNAGWRAANHPLVWFVDSDCVAEPDALTHLLPVMDDPKVGGVSGSYGIMNPESLLACLIHEEIIERHRAMPSRVDFLATFNVLYRRSVLQQVGGLDERYLKGQDAELSFRVMAAGHDLGFVLESRVRHYHATSWQRYLRTQRQQGYWRVWLHMAHRGHAAGDSYSRLSDHAQPPLAMAALVSAPLLFCAPFRWVPLLFAVLLALVQVPLTMRLVQRLGKPKYLMFGVMSFVRAFWRGVGLTHGMVAYFMTRDKGSSRSRT